MEGTEKLKSTFAQAPAHSAELHGKIASVPKEEAYTSHLLRTASDFQIRHTTKYGTAFIHFSADHFKVSDL